MATFSRNGNETRDADEFARLLGALPNEVLHIIFSYLPPSVLALLQESEDDWVREISLQIKSVDYGPCPYILPHLAIQYLKPRKLNTTKVHADNMLFVGGWRFQENLAKCRNLRVLSIRNCKVKFANVWLLFRTLYHIKDFSYTIDLESVCSGVLAPAKTGCKLEKLTLDVYSSKILLLFVDRFSFAISELTTLKLNFFLPNVRSIFHATILDLVGISIPNLPCLDSLIVRIPFSVDLTSYWESHALSIEGILNAFLHTREPEKPWKSLWIPGCFQSVIKSQVKNTNFDSRSVCMLLEETERREFLPSLKTNEGESALEALGLYTGSLDMNKISVLSSCSNKRLKKLVFSPLSICTIEDVAAFQSFLRKFTNLTDLDLRPIHNEACDQPSLSDLIKELKSLKRLCVAVCAITDHPCVIPTSGTHGLKISQGRLCRHPVRCARKVSSNSRSFEEMVKSCSQVEEFVLSNCLHHDCKADSEFRDETIEPIYNWHQLKHLRLLLLDTMRLCSFLHKIGLYCKNFKSLQLVGCGPHTVFHFNTGFKPFFRHSQSLAHLKIVHNAFNYNDALFWGILSHAQNVESLCITTKFNRSADFKPLIKCVKELPNLMSFHFRCGSPGTQNLDKTIRGIISKRSGRCRNEVDVVVEQVHCVFEEPYCMSDWCCRNMLV